MIDRKENINIHNLILEKEKPVLPFSVEADITEKDWEGITRAWDEHLRRIGDYEFLSGVKALSYEKYLHLEAKPINSLSYEHFEARTYEYGDVIRSLKLVASLKDLFNFKLDWWQESRLHGQFLQHHKKVEPRYRLHLLNLGREALGSRIKISEEFTDEDKQECLSQLNNNFYPEDLRSYSLYVDFADLFGTDELTYKPDEKTWKKIRSYLAFFRDGADYRDWSAFVEYAALFKTFTTYAPTKENHTLPEMRRF